MSQLGVLWNSDEMNGSLGYWLEAAGGGTVPAGGSPKLSKRQLKKAAKGGGKPKKEKPVWGDGKKKKEKKKASAPIPVFVNKTPKGDKKDLSDEMAPGYQPLAVEAAWQDWWEKSGYYGCDATKIPKDTPYEDKFIMVIPPPNVTGSLHLGHALTVAIEDCLTRWHRMSGRHTLWVPGTDHAGIATQSVVEKKLMKDQGINRHDLGREEFVKTVWKWKEEYGTKITTQLRFLGTSVDWDREAFTMDANLTKAVQEAFVRFFEAGIIFRANRLVNWSCSLKSAISEIEVDKVDLTGPTKISVPGHDPKKKYEFGSITSFAYKVEDSEEEIVVATTRLETMLGDTAVAVHPDDPRYAHLHGKCVVHPFNNRKIPIVLDKILVDMEFGTGAVKITPAHDPNDYECGKRNNLPEITIIDENGKINAEGGEFAGMMRYDARIAVADALEKKGMLRGKAPNPMQLPKCSRSGDIIEPLLKPQWYVDCKDMAKRSCDAVRDGSLEIIPEFHKKTWFRWLESIRDWCISRQLWWGHRIPAYFCWQKSKPKPDPNAEANYKQWVVERSEELAKAKAAALLGCDVGDVEAMQDPDVLDTWFSSGLFPFSVFGWPDPSVDLDTFYPTTLLETGHDIIFFWVARMVMMGLQLTDKLPFTKVYLHAMVRDKYGRKMSKSLGNVIDPLEVINGCSLTQLFAKLETGNLPPKEIEKAKKGQAADFPDGIPECGADALRFGLLAYTVQGRDVNLDILRVVGYRNFCNKLWNVVRFCHTNLGKDFCPPKDVEAQLFGALKTANKDKFVLSRLYECCKLCKKNMEDYLFGNVTSALHDFWQHDLCDNYLEAIKPVMTGDDADAKFASQCTLWLCLDYGLRLMHPLMPFVTEELWQRTPSHGVNLDKDYASIMLAPYPLGSPAWKDENAETTFKTVQNIVHSARSLRADYKLTPQQRPNFFVRCSTPEMVAMCSAEVADIKTLSKAGSVTVLDNAPAPSGCAMHVMDETCQVNIELKGMVDFAAEIQKLEGKMKKMEPLISTIEKKQAKADYETKTPDKVKATNQEKLDKYRKEKADMAAAIEGFKKLL